MWRNQCRISAGRLSRRTWLFWWNSIGVRLSWAYWLKGIFIRVKKCQRPLFLWLEIIQYYSISNISTNRKSKTVKNLPNTHPISHNWQRTSKPFKLIPASKNRNEFLDGFTFKHLRPQWIQAQKTGAVINFNRWRDWDGKSLRGLDWYKEEEAKEYEG